MSTATVPVDSNNPVSPGLVSSFRLASIAAAAVVGIAAGLDIIGWMFDIVWLKRPLDLRPELQSATAICLLISSISLLLLSLRQVQQFPASRWIARILGGVLIAVGAANFIEFSTGNDFQLAQTLWQPSTSGFGLQFPGPMAPDVALTFVLLGAGFVFYGVSIRALVLHQVLALLVAVPNIIVTGSYSAGIENICAFFGCVKLSPMTGMLVSTIALAMLFSKPEEGLTKILVINTSGARLVRSIIPGLVFLLPVIIVVEAGQKSGLYDQVIAVAIIFFIGLAILGASIFWGARRIDTIELENIHQKQLLEESLAGYSQAKRSMKRVCLQCAREFSDLEIWQCPDDGAPMHLIAERLREGTVFAEKYEVLSLLGTGGISIVYLARHLLLDKNVALKLLHAHFSTDGKYVQRFQIEAKAMSKLSHPCVAGIYDFGVSMDGEPYLVMDYLEGESLGDAVKEKGPLPWQRAIPLFTDICEGLRHAHVNGIIHRDLKPANVMLVSHPIKGRTAKLVDFGLAKSEDISSQLTQTGDIIGSPAYMSPEQTRGSSADKRSDIYALGALMYDCLAGRPPLVGGSVYETLMLHATQPPDSFSEELKLPQWLQDCIFKALDKDPDERQQEVDEILAEFQAGITSTLMSAPRQAE